MSSKAQEVMAESGMPLHAHRQVQASRAKVDEGLAPLLELLWKAGYDTQYSCQGGLEPGFESNQGGVAQPSIFREMLHIDGQYTFPDDRPSDAHVIFGKYEDGAAFLRYSVIKMGWPKSYYDPLWCDLMVLEAISPLRNKGVQPRAKVTWASGLTKKLIEAWSEEDQVGSQSGSGVPTSVECQT